MTKMAVMRIYGKNPLKVFFPGISGPISMKLGMKHRRIKSIIVYSNGDPTLTLTYFTARSNFVTYAFMWENVTMMDSLEIIADLMCLCLVAIFKIFQICSKTSCQVSAFRTAGHLVIFYYIFFQLEILHFLIVNHSCVAQRQKCLSLTNQI